MLERVHKRQAGVTLIELMVTVAIFAILVGMAVPSFERSFRKSHVDTATNSLVSGLATARAEAIHRGKSITICASAEPSVNMVCGLPGAGVTRQAGWIVFDDNNSDGNVTAGETVIRIGEPTDGVAVTNILNFPQNIVFSSRGTVPALTAINQDGTLQIDANPGSTGDRRLTIRLSPVGRTSTALGVHP